MMKQIIEATRTGFLFGMIIGLTFVLMACEPGWGTDGCDPIIVPSIPIGEQYAEAGPYRPATTTAEGYRIHHPVQMDGSHPIIAWGKGPENPAQTYHALLNHLASWGFVVIVPDNAAGMLGGVDYLILQHRKPDSPFCGMLDTGKVGAAGYSQAANDAIAAAVDPRITCTLLLGPGPIEAGNVQGPIFVAAGAESAPAAPAKIRATIFDRCPAPTVFGIVKDLDHMDILSAAKGYATAWLLFQLQNDIFAGEAFVGRCEICSDARWEVFKNNF